MQCEANLNTSEYGRHVGVLRGRAPLMNSSTCGQSSLHRHIRQHYNYADAEPSTAATREQNVGLPSSTTSFDQKLVYSGAHCYLPAAQSTHVHSKQTMAIQAMSAKLYAQKAVRLGFALSILLKATMSGIAHGYLGAGHVCPQHAYVA